MNDSRADRIIADWDRVSRQASPPALRPRTVVTTALAGPSIAGIAILVVAIAAAGVWLSLPRGDGSPGAGASASATQTWGPLAVVPPSRGFGEALAAGTLHITDTCVFLEEAGDDLALLVWPADRTTWNADERAVIFENVDGSTVWLRDGERVTFGGGGDSVAESGIPGEEWANRTEWISRPAASCPIDARWTVAEVVTDRRPHPLDGSSAPR